MAYLRSDYAKTHTNGNAARLFAVLLYAAMCGVSAVHAQPYSPRITELSAANPVFAQYAQDVEIAYRQIAAGKPVTVLFYSYTAKRTDTLFSLAARCSIPYEAIALLNDIPAADTVLEQKELFLPNAPGLFIPAEPVTNLGIILRKRYYTLNEGLCYTVNGRIFQYIPSERLNPTERAYFLDTSLKMPLPGSILTSKFGMRASPITGAASFHRGIDLAAPQGTDVFACKSGVIANTGFDDVYGNFIIIDHDNNTQSVYAHLSRILVEKGNSVTGGSIIGNVGSTGLSTGPHLHFEIRINGSAQDPRKFLPAF
ncbi:LysM peptidoglycan-binding domain-containing M23 family metallopeptidase [Treponema brennaborense]|uniref:Peptidase M23 n=1 Tax=Treponema brennaborense (strain DSM 12168 / CIP 105900 / DD5/3) TaxID=906968 RepID=F4LQG3_TREBD|nr:M23 family metallopeptidase [Treponema brennaborense]AEE17172.1 Peptidase M23 [Treponema brennaborense DSM 12168]